MRSFAYQCVCLMHPPGFIPCSSGSFPHPVHKLKQPSVSYVPPSCEGIFSCCYKLLFFRFRSLLASWAVLVLAEIGWEFVSSSQFLLPFFLHPVLLELSHIDSPVVSWKSLHRGYPFFFLALLTFTAFCLPRVGFVLILLELILKLRSALSKLFKNALLFSSRVVGTLE